MAKGRILLVEDDRALVELLVYHFEREDFEVRATAEGEEALLLAREAAPDVVILDWMLEGLSGIEVCRRLRRMAETANVPIIMLTARGEEADRIRGLETGADDYVTKPFSPRELVARMLAVLRRVRPALAGERLSYADLEMDVVSHRVKRGGAAVALGPTEWGILVALAAVPGRVYSRFELINRVRGYEFEGYERTVDSHVKNLRRKIEDDPANPQIILTVLGGGYRLGLAADG